MDKKKIEEYLQQRLDEHQKEIQAMDEEKTTLQKSMKSKSDIQTLQKILVIENRMKFHQGALAALHELHTQL